MGLIANVIDFIRMIRGGSQVSDVKMDPGGGAINQAEHYGPSGDDSHPLPTDKVYTARTQRSGGLVALGYLDPENVPKALEGEKRIYSRDASGAVMAEIWLKNTGEVEISNALGSMLLQPDGTFNINGVLIDLVGNITVPPLADVTDGTISLKLHKHSGVTPGVGTSGPSVP